ncbi:MAG: hypothetical protein KAH20_03970 [Methylococcales bacterium]|nr:hypothetical protein [Methylococcales bacterium]
MLNSSIKKLYILFSIGIIGLIGFLALFNSSSTKLSLRVGISQWPGYETLFLARSLGHIDSSSIKLVELPSATEVIQALRSGSLEVATLTLGETLSLLAIGIDLTVVAVMDISLDADTKMTQPVFNSLYRLEGKRISLETTTAGGIVRSSEHEQVSIKPTVVADDPLTINEQTQSIASKKNDAVVTFKSIKAHFLSPGVVPLFDNSSNPGRIINVLVVRSSTLKTDTSTICSLVAAQFQALTYFQNYPREAIQLMAPRLQILPRNLLQSYLGLSLPDIVTNRKILRKSDDSLHISAKKLADFMFKKRLINDVPNLTHLIDSRCIDGKNLE